MNNKNVNTFSAEVCDGPTLSDLSSNYAGWIARKRGAELAVLQAQSIFDCKTAYSPEQFREFCSTLGLPVGSDHLEKLLAIGANADRLDQVEFPLPASLDGLYFLSQLPDHSLKELARGVLMLRI